MTLRDKGGDSYYRSSPKNWRAPMEIIVDLTKAIPDSRVMESLLDDREQLGTPPATWDASRFSSGVYFYRLTEGTYHETKRMILMK